VPAELGIKLDGAIESARLMIRWLASDQPPQARRIS
jgi:hypothetical protein